MWSIATEATLRHATAILMRRIMMRVSRNISPAHAARMYVRTLKLRCCEALTVVSWSRSDLLESPAKLNPALSWGWQFERE